MALSSAVVTTTLTSPSFADPANPDDAAIATADAQVAASDKEVADLVATLTQAESDIAALENEMGGLREAVNKALVDLHDAQASAEEARQKAKEAREDLDRTQSEMEVAQARLDELSRAAYKQGATTPGITTVAGADAARDALDRKTYIRTTAEAQEKAIAELDRLRTEKANNESALRLARNLADERAAAAQEAERVARTKIEENSAKIQQRTAERDQLVAERDAAQQKLDASRSHAGQLLNQRKEYEQFQAALAEKAKADKAAQEAAAARAAAAADAEAKRQAAAEASKKAEAHTANTPAAAGTASAAPAAPAQPAQPATPQTQPETATTAAADTATQERQKAAEAARQAAEAAAAAEREAQQRAADEKAAEDARKAAEVAASLAAAALVAIAAPNHTEVDNPYPNDPEADDVPVAATNNDDTIDVNGLAPTRTATPNTTTPTTTTRAPQAPATTTATPAEPESNATELGDNSGDLLNLLDQLTNTTKPGSLKEVTNTASTVVSGSREEKIEKVIARAMSQIGTPYAWGGGDANGPTKGIRDGGVADAHGDYNKIGFDCSGLTLYAFAGVGIALPHYTGYQYQRGTKVDPSQMQRGDLIFYGPNAENHVAIYLGDGQMIEAPQSGSTVHISPVRWGGMSPKVVRLI
ncbi:hypothetical protein CAQU_06540 [Corynebacterium aquilae DSM 44791]|uniref:NlpC/P60 domain-containing protein n=1 Tax=Corynebacterium aquilae DSM 44791 TaxID=1431546 RepID=A0A1L7CFZ8_9CORY|nr:hypothetical protein CAQU_06540 [Corynebacterium aquilae DSM 44791]